MKFSRIRPFRNYSSNSIRLDMAEMNECPSKEFQTLLVDEIDYLDLVAYPDYEYVSNLERKLVDTYFGLHGTTINSIVDAGSDALIKLCVEAFCPSHGSILFVNPSFPMYKIYALAQGRQVRNYDLLDDPYRLTLCRTGFLNISMPLLIEEVKTSKPNMLFFSNPNSPFGGYTDDEAINKLAKVMQDWGGILILDHAYMEFYNSALNYEVPQSNILIIKTFSKAWGLAGCRVGFGFGRSDLTEALKDRQLTYPISNVSLKAANLAVDHFSQFSDFFKRVSRSRDVIASRLAKFNTCIFSNTNSIHWCIPDTKLQGFTKLLEKHDVLIKGFGTLGTPATPVEVPIRPMKQGHWCRMSIIEDLEKTNWFEELVEIMEKSD